MKTDPATTDYIVEAGATRNYEPWRDADAARDAAWLHLRAVVGEISKVQSSGPDFDPARSLAA